MSERSGTSGTKNHPESLPRQDSRGLFDPVVMMMDWQVLPRTQSKLSLVFATIARQLFS